ncbi:MAG: hypothetical protein Q8L84_00410 [Hyphomonas sp.]|jgi:hypothetical protein|nr:hypothetical protein [Hyphomonas sp.]
MFRANPGRERRDRCPATLPGADMRIAIAIFVIIGIFLEPAWSQVLPAAGI